MNKFNFKSEILGMINYDRDITSMNNLKIQKYISYLLELDINNSFVEYKNYIENNIIDNIKTYYTGISLKLIDESNIIHYLTKVFDFISFEISYAKKIIIISL